MLIIIASLKEEYFTRIHYFIPIEELFDNTQIIKYDKTLIINALNSYLPKIQILQTAENCLLKLPGIYIYIYNIYIYI